MSGGNNNPTAAPATDEWPSPPTSDPAASTAPTPATTAPTQQHFNDHERK